MKTLIIPDVHNKVAWAEGLVSAHPGYQVVFLGDYFDSYEDTPEMARRTAEWLRYSIHQRGRIHLMGNHDIPYRWRHQTCPGFHPDKYAVINRIMTPTDWAQVDLVWIKASRSGVRPLVVSHAGFSLASIYGCGDYTDVAPGGRLEHLRTRLPQEHLAEIRNQARRALVALHEQRGHFWLNQGSRMGRQDVGGPFWADRHALRCEPRGLDQIVGHTHVREPRCHCIPHKQAPEAKVWFVDGAGKYAAVVHDEPAEDGGWKITPIHAQGEKLGQPTQYL